MVCGLSVAALITCPACSRRGESDHTATASGVSASGTAQAPASTDDDGQWVMAAKDFANTRYSRLSDIKADNVASLKLAWTFSTGVNAGHEAAPLVVNSTMYVVTPWPNVLHAGVDRARVHRTRRTQTDGRRQRERALLVLRGLQLDSRVSDHLFRSAVAVMGGHAAQSYWEHVGLLMLIGGMLLGPFAWFVDLQISYAAVK